MLGEQSKSLNPKESLDALDPFRGLSLFQSKSLNPKPYSLHPQQEAKKGHKMTLNLQQETKKGHKMTRCEPQVHPEP